MSDKKYNFLLVEDDVKTLDRLKFDLNALELSNEIFTAENGLKGLDVYKRTIESGLEIDIIISDIVMPECNGIEFLQKFREQFDPQMQQAIIMLTSKSDKSLVLKAINFGVSQYLLKPWNHQGLMQKVLAVIGDD
jgi:YesN/AraC family two-component response regulator